MPSDVIIVVLLGLLVATSGILAYRLSERAQRPTLLPPSDEDVTSILGALPLVSILLNSDGTIGRVSPEAYTAGLVRSGHLELPELADLVDTVTREGVPTSEQIRWTRVDGTHVIFDFHAAPLSNGRVLVLGHDLTTELRLDETRRDFVANVSHELKTPVGALALLAETVETAAEDPQAVRRFAHRMEVESRRLSALIDDIIGLSRVQSPETKPAIAPVPLAPLLARAQESLAVEAESRAAIIQVSATAHVVMADAELLFIAVRNLIDNAVRYGPGGGTVTVETKARAGVVQIRITDEGSGIEEVEHRRIFERFYRVDHARSRNTGGTGLGLSMVKHIAVNHGGNIEVYSRPGAGSTFVLSIPQGEGKD